jgi:hypothetical protein
MQQKRAGRLIVGADRPLPNHDNRGDRPGKRPPETGGLKTCPKQCPGRDLFGGDLLLRVERPGVVDFLDLMVREPQNVAEDLVGMFAEQR